MKCDRCRKKPATMHLTRVEQGKVREDHLCANCASEALPPEDMKVAREAPEESKRNSLTCPSCRHVNQKDWNFCSACGAMREP